MFPLRDTVPGRRPPVVVWALVLINPQALHRFIDQYAMVPARLTAPGGLERYWLTVITAMFLHGGWLHLIGNMWFLWIFGDNVEDRFGPLGFLALYILGGTVAGSLQVVTDPHSAVATLGASGAIAAVLGAYLVLFPGARVITLIPIFLFPWIVSIPAVVWLGIWFLGQWLNGMVVLPPARRGRRRLLGARGRLPVRGAVRSTGAADGEGGARPRPPAVLLGLRPGVALRLSLGKGLSVATTPWRTGRSKRRNRWQLVSTATRRSARA